MLTFDLDAYVAHSGALNLPTIDSDDVARHPLPVEAVRTLRYMQDIESHTIYFRHAEIRLPRPRTAWVARLLVDRFWAPVGTGVQHTEELRFLAAYLFSGDEGRAAARKVDDTIRRLPGFDDGELLEAWMDLHVNARPGGKGGSNGHRHH
jgi:hypothetical protein